MDRRDFNRLVAAMLAAPKSFLVAASSIRFDASTRTWLIGNSYFEREITFDAARGLITRRFVDKNTGRNWIASRTRWGADTFLIIDDDVLYGASPSDRFHYLDHEIEGNLLRIRLQLQPQRLNIDLNYRVHDDSAFMEQWCVLENASDKPIGPIERFDPFLLPLERRDYVLNWVHGIRDYGHQRGVGENIQPYAPYRVRREPLTSTITLSSSSAGERYGRRNMSTTEYLSWFALEDPTLKAGLMGGLEWSGAWVLHFARLDQATLVYGGVDRFAHILAPGATLESPRVFYGPYTGDVDSGLRGFHSYLKKHLMPPADEHFPWVTFNTWYAFYWRFSEAELKREVLVARELGIECFCVDAGWWEGPPDTGLERGLGSWVPSREKFPGGLAGFADYVRQNGMKFGIWFEPERANHEFVGGRIKEKWLSKHDGYYVGLDDTHILCLGVPEVREWVKRRLEKVLRDTGAEWIRFDLNVYNICNREDHGHQRGDGDYQHIHGLYEVLGWLAREFPHLHIENCAGGGNRSDYGLMRYSHTYWNSDGAWPSYRVRYQVFGSSYAYPSRYQNTNYVYQGGTTGHSHSYGRQEKTDADTPAGYLDYLFRSRLMGSFGISDRMSQWPENIRAAAKRAVQAMKRARPILQGDVYHLLRQPLILTPPLSEPTQWEALQYHDPVLDRAVVFCFRALAPESELTLRIRGIDPQLLYEVTYENSGKRIRIRGGQDVTVQLSEQNRSEILWIERA